LHASNAVVFASVGSGKRTAQDGCGNVEVQMRPLFLQAINQQPDLLYHAER
jgi:hypothetical protein